MSLQPEVAGDENDNDLEVVGDENDNGLEVAGDENDNGLEVADDENDNGLEVQESQVHDDSIISGQVSPPDPSRHQGSTIDHVGEGSSQLVTPAVLWQRPLRSLKQRAAAASKHGSQPFDAPIQGPPLPLADCHGGFNTEHYFKFNRDRPYGVQRAGFFSGGMPDYSIYDRYHLCMDPNINRAEDVPQLPLRLDDRLCALVYEKFRGNQLHSLWPSEFDYSGMVRATRVPLGHAAKHYYQAGDIDYDGKKLYPGEEGWYYLWLGGLHCLMGKEGWDAGRYLKRPPGEKKIMGFAFKKSHMAVIQAPSGWVTGDLSGP